MDPVEALRRTAYLLERRRDLTRRVQAYRKAADRLELVGPDETAARASAGTLTELPDVGPKTATLARQALAGEVPEYLAELEQ